LKIVSLRFKLSDDVALSELKNADVVIEVLRELEEAKLK